jgi:putative sterol carrier protein
MKFSPEKAFARFVRGRSDDQLDRLFGSERAMTFFFATMARQFNPDRAGGFEGRIQYVIESPRRGTGGWVIEVHGDHAHAGQGRAERPSVTIRTTVPVFLRIAAGEVNPALALLKKDLVVEGNYGVALRLAAMFGAVPSQPTTR